ncbi:hypothetical protein ANCCAN_08067 [Ancylostoma caninum]|uniref:Uncharacterized protein n=1 Tax=Ancylostoma caninum TaxID=29170 RepID=A0A368GNF8_ANCCA|nr:hypothetical protein ANCCAN_08067 [Ancylostoma caninum]
MAQSFLSSQNMLSVYIFAIAVVSLATAVVRPRDCDFVENDLTESDIYLKLLNRRRLNLAEGKQLNGPSGGPLPRGNVGEMVSWSCNWVR